MLLLLLKKEILREQKVGKKGWNITLGLYFNIEIDKSIKIILL